MAFSDEPVQHGRKLIARLDRIPIWPYSQRVMFTVGVGFFFAFYDVVTIGLVLPALERAFMVSFKAISWTITSSLIGYIVGSFIDSRIADIFGRKVSLFISVLAFTVGALICASSTNLSMIIFGRFITGMGIGAEIASITAYMEELSPAHVRGKSTSKAIAFGMLGFAVVPFIGLALVPHFVWGWRFLFLTGAVGGITIFFMRMFVPESPRWLMLQGKIKELENMVTRAERYAENRLEKPLPAPANISGYPFETDTALKNIFQARFLKRIVLFAGIWFIYYIGNYAWLTLATSLFYHHGFALTKSLAFVAISSLGFVFGSFFITLLSDRVERKWLSCIIALIWTFALLMVGWCPRPSLIVLFGFIATTTIAMIIPIMYIYTGENFPTRLRATCLSITDGVGHLGGAFCAQIVLGISQFFSKPHQYTVAFTIMAVSGLITAIILLLGLKMTKQSLSELANPDL